MDDVWTRQDSQRQTDHLQILTPRRGTDVARLCADIIDDGLLKPWDQEMRPLFNDLLLDSRQTVKNDGSSPALDIVDRPTSAVSPGKKAGCGFGERSGGRTLGRRRGQLRRGWRGVSQAQESAPSQSKKMSWNGRGRVLAKSFGRGWVWNFRSLATRPRLVWVSLRHHIFLPTFSPPRLRKENTLRSMCQHRTRPTPPPTTLTASLPQIPY
jgi:hypothetical protein